MKVTFYRVMSIQPDSSQFNLFKSFNFSTCFVWYLHPSSAAHNTVSTVSGINETRTANSRERGLHSAYPHSRQLAVTVSLIPDTVDTVI